MIFAVASSAVLTSSMVAEASNVVSSSGLNAVVENVSESNGTNTLFEEPQRDSGSSGTTVQTAAPDHWDAEKNERFKDLARGEVLRELSVEEEAELERLTWLRRVEQNPRPADEILWQRRQQKLTHGLVEALRAYVDFHETTHNS